MAGIMAWLRANKLLVATLSVVGSIAGLGFASVDLHSELKKKKYLK